MFRSLLALSALLAFSSIAAAQTTTGTMTGRVTDESGSTIGGATVSILNQATNVKQVVVSTSDGNFVQPYVLRVSTLSRSRTRF